MTELAEAACAIAVVRERLVSAFQMVVVVAEAVSCLEEWVLELFYCSATCYHDRLDIAL